MSWEADNTTQRYAIRGLNDLSAVIVHMDQATTIHAKKRWEKVDKPVIDDVPAVSK